MLWGNSALIFLSLLCYVRWWQFLSCLSTPSQLFSSQWQWLPLLKSEEKNVIIWSNLGRVIHEVFHQVRANWMKRTSLESRLNCSPSPQIWRLLDSSSVTCRLAAKFVWIYNKSRCKPNKMNLLHLKNSIYFNWRKAVFFLIFWDRQRQPPYCPQRFPSHSAADRNRWKMKQWEMHGCGQ